MKRLIYSDITKFIAVILFIASISFGVVALMDGLAEVFGEEDFIYGFERDFSESNHLSSLLNQPTSAIFNAYYDLNHSKKESELTIYHYVDRRLDNLYCANKVNYYVKIDEMVYKNCAATDSKELLTGLFYSYAERNSNGKISYDFKPSNRIIFYLFEDIGYYDQTSSIIISVNVKEEYVEECRIIWEAQRSIVRETIIKTFSSAVLALLLLIYLICVCGKNKDGEQKTIWLDNIWVEIHIAVIIGVVIGTIALCMIVIDEFFNSSFPLDLTRMIVCSASALASVLLVTSMLSVIRNIKCKRFLGSSLVFCVLRFAFGVLFKILKWIGKGIKIFVCAIASLLFKKTGILLIGGLLLYSGIIFLFGIFTYEASFFLFSALIVFLLAAFILGLYCKDINEIKKGVSMVRNGNVSYKIPELKSSDMKMLANNINDISKGLDESVSAKVKAEKMKTELITNVSHDLKTPITSIVNYAELLSNLDGLSEEARDYIQVISKKSERLKKLTQDLFDISKAQSGNENVVLEKLDVSVLIDQSLGELDNDIKSSELPFCVDIPKELYILADGRKISRVVGNLINNILKYALKGTRIFISASEKDGNIVIEFKNIASYPMDFNAEDIVGRFVRGDESRTADGNGLGLAIAKSYTELCNGKFEVVIDGDMFKAIITFRKYGQ